MKWGDKQHPGMVNPLHSYIGTSHGTILAGQWEEQRGLQWVGNLDGVSGVTWRGFIFPFSQGRGVSHSNVHCSAVKSHLCSVLWGLQLQNLLCQWSWLQPRQKKGFRDGALAQSSRTLKPFCLQECPILCCSSTAPIQINWFTVSWVTSPSQEFSQWFMVALSWRETTSHSCAMCQVFCVYQS